MQDVIHRYIIGWVAKMTPLIKLWESKFDGLLAMVKEYIVDVWEI